ncbi:MAG TPA: serine/threonine-protein kinase [Vicinamibacterales bacterium]|nr:serine/threonine-protein kinase [Vicinamibacterales bacterium]
MAREDFELLDPKPIGRGQFGTVFAARRRSDGRLTALKVILHAGENGAATIAAERHGAILQQAFAAEHGMVPEVFDFGPDGDDFYIAMELVEGPSLEERLRRGRLPYDDAVGHAIWLCQFLDRAHGFSATIEQRRYRLLHNDLKPAHLKIPENGERKVLDFGMAKVLEEARDLATDVGRTIAYAAPERLRSERVNVHADFWSLGVMLYEMVSGHRPYPLLEDPRLRRQLYSAITNNAPRAALPPDCPVHLQAIIHRLLAFQPAHRYQRASEILADLERFARRETPMAAVYYETPATLPVSRGAAAAVVETEPVTLTEPRLAPPAVAMTDPLPAPPPPLAARTEAVPAVQPAGVPPARTAARPALRRLAGAIATVLLIGIVLTEGVEWLFAEGFRKTIPGIDERAVVAAREAYDAIERWALLDVGLRMRVNSQLLSTLRTVGDRVIADYRREVPTMGPEEWRQAQAAFAWARVLAPRDGTLLAKQLTADAHVRRLAAQRARPQSTPLAQAAVARFRDAAAADPRSFDPYVGMAMTQLYVLADVDGAIQSLDEAVKRGYSITRRDTALLGDASLRRGLMGKRRAALLTGDQRIVALEKAKADFETCVASFERIVEFGNAAKHVETCKTQLRQIVQQLTPEEALPQEGREF